MQFKSIENAVSINCRRERSHAIRMGIRAAAVRELSTNRHTHTHTFAPRIYVIDSNPVQRAPTTLRASERSALALRSRRTVATAPRNLHLSRPARLPHAIAKVLRPKSPAICACMRFEWISSIVATARVCDYEYSIVCTERTIERFHLACKQRRVQRHARKKCAHTHASPVRIVNVCVCLCLTSSLTRGAATNTVSQLIPTFAPVPNPSPCSFAMAILQYRSTSY